MSQFVPFTQFEGLLPALDPRQVTKPFVVEGRNFIVDAEGPISSFGSNFASYARLADPINQQSMRVGNEVFQAQNEGFWGYDITSQAFYPLFITTPVNDIFPWSQAYVGGKYYFAKKGSALIQFNPSTNNWKTVDPAHILGTIYAVSNAGGRLLILTEFWLQWSAIDDGEDLETDLDKGIGAQQISVHAGSGKPLGLLPTADGAITYTETGWMKTEYIQALNPFRHYPLAGSDYAPITQFCIAELSEQQHVILTKSGFYITSGGRPEEWQPLWNEFLRNDILVNFDLSNERLFRIYSDWDKQIFSLSLAQTPQEGVYTYSGILYLPTQKWGSFDKPHHTFGELNLTTPPRSGFNFGFVCAITGCINRFVEQPITERPIDRNLIYHYQSPYDFPARLENGMNILPTYNRMRTVVDETQFNNLSGIYDITTVAPQERDLGSIDSYVIVGFLRMTQETEPDRLIEVTDVHIGTDEVAQAAEEIDYMDEAQFPGVVEIDHMDEGQFPNVVEIDYGYRVIDAVNYTAIGKGTLDAKIPWNGQVVTLIDTFTEGGTRLFSGKFLGLYNLVELNAQEEGQSFHLKLLEFRALLGGRV